MRLPWKKYDCEIFDQLDAPTDIQKGILYAAAKGGVRFPLESVAPLIDALLWADKVTDDDRRVLADWLRGEIKQPAHRPPDDQRLLTPQVKTKRMLGVHLYRKEMDRRRKAREPVRGMKDKVIAEVAANSGVNVTPEQLRLWVDNRGRRKRDKPEKTRDL